MAYKRFIMEFGMGADLHGGDVTKAAQRAVKDAVSRSCLCGLFEICNIKDPNEMRIDLKVGCPFPDRLDREAVSASVPFGEVTLHVCPGGLEAPGLHLPALGEGDAVVVAVAALTVFVDVRQPNQGV